MMRLRSHRNKGIKKSNNHPKLNEVLSDLRAFCLTFFFVSDLVLVVLRSVVLVCVAVSVFRCLTRAFLNVCPLYVDSCLGSTGSIINSVPVSIIRVLVSMSAFVVVAVELLSMLTSVCFSTFRVEQERRRRGKNKTKKNLLLIEFHSKVQPKKPASQPLANF